MILVPEAFGSPPKLRGEGLLVILRSSARGLGRAGPAEVSDFISRFFICPASKAAAEFCGWGSEDVEVPISSLAMAMAAEEVGWRPATVCMEDDAFLAAISNIPHTLHHYCNQRSA
eukprot:gene33961-43871_t